LPKKGGYAHNEKEGGPFSGIGRRDEILREIDLKVVEEKRGCGMFKARRGEKHCFIHLERNGEGVGGEGEEVYLSFAGKRLGAWAPYGKKRRWFNLPSGGRMSGRDAERNAEAERDQAGSSVCRRRGKKALSAGVVENYF